MIPASYLSPSTAQAILDTLDQGRGTAQGSNNTYAVLPSLTGGLMTTALTDRILSTDLSTVTTISTAGLTAAEADTLAGIRTRVNEGLATAYADYPKQNPLNDHNTGVPVAAPDQAHRVDVIIQTILFWDPRYFLRLRSNVGADAENSQYELPSRYNYLTNPMIIATMRLHGFTSNVANVGPGTSSVTSTVPHGYYSGMTIEDTATFTATTWTANVSQNNPNSSNIAAVDTFFTTNAAPTISTGVDINIATQSPTWTAVNNLGAAQVAVSGNQLRFYRDVARTDQIRMSWGDTVSTGWQGTDTPTERVAVNTDGIHLINPTIPLQFNYISGNTAPSIYELKYVNDYNPTTQTWTSNVAGYSIADGQLVNTTGTLATATYANPVADSSEQYFKRLNDTSYQIYRTADLSSGNVWAFGNTTTISNIAYSSGNTVWQVNFDSTVEYPPLLSGQDIRFANTSGAADFSAAVAITQNSAGGNIQISANNRSFIYSALGTVSGAERLVAAASGEFVYTNDALRWNTATTIPSGGVLDDVRWNTVSSRFEARIINAGVTGPNFYVWTSTTGITWANTTSYSYSFTPPDEDIWVGQAESDGYTLISNQSTGELQVAVGATSFQIRFGVFGTSIDNANSTICTTTNLVVVRTPTTIYRVPKTLMGSTSQWRITSNATLINQLNRVTATVVRCVASTGRTILITDTGSGGAGTVDIVPYTVGAVEVPVIALGLIRGNYSFANFQGAGVTEGYYRDDLATGELTTNFADRLTATGHKFTTGQQVRTSATFNYNGTIVTPPQNLWVEVFDANTFDVYQDADRNIAYTSGRPSGAMTASTVTRVFYVKYRSARTWDLYLGADVTDTANRFTDNTLVTGGTTTGSTRWNGYLTSIVNDTDVFIRPMFYAGYLNSTRVALWVDLARTVPYNWFGRNGTLRNQQTSYSTVARYFVNSHAYDLAIGGDQKIDVVIGINATPVYYAQVVNDFVINLYADAALTIPYTKPTWSNSAATLWQVNPSQAGSYRLDQFYVPNIGTKTYFTTNLTTNTTTVNATWAGSDRKFYTRFVQTQSVFTNPTVLVNEHAFANAGPYFGQLRYTDTSGPGGPGNVAVVSGTTFGGFGGPTPVYYQLNAPGRFNTDAPTLFGIDAEPNSGTAPAVDEALAYTGDEWATASNLTDRTLRRWPSTIAPVSMTWTIEQPNSTLETYNLTRYNRARDVTQYRMRLTYPAMTKSQVAEFTGVIHAAKGSFKPMLFTPPVNSVTQQYVTVKVGDKNSTVPAVFRARVDNASGVQVLQVDGLPPSLNLTDPAFDAGWAVELPIRNSTGSWGIPIHAVQTNAYGEANMRLNNNIASAIDFGAAIGADAADLDVFIDADSIELKVDTRGFHYLEVDLVTKRIF